MKKYQCHKIVEAEPENRMIPITEDGHTRASMARGYKVVYEDGYISWSPKDVFEAGYTEIK